MNYFQDFRFILNAQKILNTFDGGFFVNFCLAKIWKAKFIRIRGNEYVPWDYTRAISFNISRPLSDERNSKWIPAVNDHMIIWYNLYHIKENGSENGSMLWDDDHFNGWVRRMILGRPELAPLAYQYNALFFTFIIIIEKSLLVSKMNCNF